MNALTPLLSDSIRECFESIYQKHNSKIAKELLDADKFIQLYNKIVNTWALTECEKTPILEILKEKIDKLITDEVRALSIRKDVFEISFTPKGKDLIYTLSNNWSRENRQTGKPGRIIKKLLVYDYKERDIELFSNQFKAELVSIGEWEIVTGSDICYWYNSDNYYKIAGTLGNSCMRYSECECYFEVYKDNASMLICVKEGKLLGRAILWNIDGKTYMDRVYVCMDYLEEQFIQYAMSNKWYIRTDQSLLSDGDDQYWLGPEDNYTFEINPTLIINLRTVYDYFPYMDSFRYLDPDDQTISTISRFGKVYLSNTEGTWEHTQCVECECCGNSEEYYGDESEDNPYYWSDYLEGYLCPDCAIWNDYLESYISKSMSLVRVYDSKLDYELIPETIVIDNLTKEHVTTFLNDYFTEIDGKYYKLSALTWDNENEQYKLKDE